MNRKIFDFMKFSTIVNYFQTLKRGCLLERGLFIKSSDDDVFGRFSVLLSHILQNQHTILRLKIRHSFYPNSHTVINMSGCLAK